MSKRKRRGGAARAKPARANATEPEQASPAREAEARTAQAAPAEPVEAKPDQAENPAPSSRWCYAALFAFVIALSIVHAIVGFWTPVQGDAWNHWVWAGQHRDAATGTWLLAFLQSHFTFSDLVGFVLARCQVFHVLVTPAVVIALVTGLFVVALRRLPRATWDDLLGLALVSALVWITQPAAGVTLFHTPNVALYVYGSALVAWFIAPFRCGWQVPRAAWPVMALAGYCVGTSTRAIATATLVGLVLALRALPRERRARWMWIALAGLIVGVAVGYARPPWIEFQRVFWHGVEWNLVRFKGPLEEGGELVSLVAALVLADLGLGLLGRGRAPTVDRPDPADALRWFLGWFGTAIWCQFGPRYIEATLLPATCMLVIAALPYLRWLARARVPRGVIVALVVGVHAIVWPMALVKYHRYGAEGAARMARLSHARPGQTPVVPPYSQISASSWFPGEDLGTARLRQLVAIEAFGLRDITIRPPFRKLEINPEIAIALDIDGASDAELRAAKVPAQWSTSLAVARKQFGLFLKRLRAVTSKPVSARLVVENVEFPAARGRPVLAAWADATGTMVPRIARSHVDANNRYSVKIYGSDAERFDEAWVVHDGRPTVTDYRHGIAHAQPMTMSLSVVVVCNRDRCLVADAFVPQF